jgi:vibriolysin
MQFCRDEGDAIVKLSQIAVSATALLAISFASLNMASAARLETVRVRSVNEIKKQYGPTSAALDAKNKARRHADMLSLEAESSLKVMTSTKDHVGTHYRYQQTFRGMPVFGATIALSEDLDGNLRVLFGRVGKELSKDLTSIDASLSAQQALTIAKRAALTGQNANIPTQFEKTEKIIYVDDNGVAHVVFRAGFFVAHPSAPSAPTFFIDAHTGEILKQWNDLRH